MAIMRGPWRVLEVARHPRGHVVWTLKRLRGDERFKAGSERGACDCTCELVELTDEGEVLARLADNAWRTASRPRGEQACARQDAASQRAARREIHHQLRMLAAREHLTESNPS